MALFNNKKELNSKFTGLEKSIKNLEDSVNKISFTIDDLKRNLDEAKKRSPDYEKEAKQSSKKTSEYRNRANETLNEVKDILEDSINTQGNINELKSKIEVIQNDLRNVFDNFNVENETVSESISVLKDRIEKTNEIITSYEEIIENHPDFESDIAELESFLDKIKENESKSNLLIRSINSRKSELDTMYNEILGYEEHDEETKETIYIPGLKQELEDSLNGLNERIDELKENFEKLEGETNENVSNLLSKNSDKIRQQTENWEKGYKTLNKEIEDLLPKALTAGLSHAFSEKKEAEDISYEKHKYQFGMGIAGMILVSLIPFIISVVTLFGEDGLDIVISRAPKLVIAILPLYIPVLWLSISSSKKMNLSKRLIEEYTHKEVLSKTYEGLSKQIQNIEENNISKDLRIKLLQDFLQMYSENPGRLISDYNSSDHPIMELLENSSKLEKTISKLENIPGLNKITNLLENKSKRKLEQASDAVEKGIDKYANLKDFKNKE